jgi:hypothetical protein
MEGDQVTIPSKHYDTAADMIKEERKAAKAKADQGPDKTETIERTEPLAIGAGMIVRHLQWVREGQGSAAAIKEGRAMFTTEDSDGPGLTDTQIDRIAAGHATLRGYSDLGISYHETKCNACRGRLPAVRDCKVCEGDGFDPPMAEMKHKQAGRR